MTDRYERIRAALAMGPTPGPWVVRYDYVVQARAYEDGRLVPVAQPYGVNCDGTDLFANARLIAACDPDTIRALLEERDALLAALREMLAIVNDSRGVAGYHLNGDTAEWDEFDEVDAAHAAIAKANGGGYE